MYGAVRTSKFERVDPCDFRIDGFEDETVVRQSMATQLTRSIAAKIRPLGCRVERTIHGFQVPTMQRQQT